MDTALLLVDIQNDYFPGGRYELHQPEKASENAALALAAFREKGLPVIHVQHISIRPGSSFFLPGTPGADIHESVRPNKEEPVVVKHAPDSFLHTGLKAILEEKGIKTLVLCGMMSHMCIDTTVRSAKAQGYEAILLHDACATRELTWQGERIPAAMVQGAFMAAIDGSFAAVMATGEYLAAL